MSRQTHAVIDLDALVHNLASVQQVSPHAKVWAVVKADAYGHGAIQVAKALSNHTYGFALAHFEEAMVLREAGVTNPILLLEGVSDQTQAQQLTQQNFTVVVHNLPTLKHLIQAAKSCDEPIKVWIKLDTGMHRLGFSNQTLASALEALINASGLYLMGIMTHLACADEPSHIMNAMQLAAFEQMVSAFPSIVSLPKSVANSAVILGHFKSRNHESAALNAPLDWLRPGIALYGASPFADQSAASLGLKPVMRLMSKIIACKQLEVGDAVGYGATYRAVKTMMMAVVGIGYGDGYPRNIEKGYLWVKGHLCPLLGRVSMDMSVIQIPDQLKLTPGEWVECWGEHISVDEVATKSNTIAYERLCQVTHRVPRVYEGQGV